MMNDSDKYKCKLSSTFTGTDRVVRVMFEHSTSRRVIPVKDPENPVASEPLERAAVFSNRRVLLDSLNPQVQVVQTAHTR